MQENDIGRAIVDSAVNLHRELGPGLLEAVYEVALGKELNERGFRVERQVPVSFEYRGTVFDEGFRMDLCIQDAVIVEVKSVKTLSDVHKKQLLTYLRLAELKLGFLLNFGESLMRDGIVRVANGLDD